MKCLEEKQKVDRRVVRFMVPIGATVNMDGGALYESLACIYLAQAYGYDLDFGKYVAIRYVYFCRSLFPYKSRTDLSTAVTYTRIERAFTKGTSSPRSELRVIEYKS